jgi:signal peptidase I
VGGADRDDPRAAKNGFRMPDAISNPTAARTAIRDAPESLKDTIESIVVALILAFVFRAFIVEAFVIPTGSMAPTLYGAHGTILCEDCGVEFAYGLRDPEDTRKGQQVLNSSEAVCPNCGHANRYLPYNDEIGNPDKGDRILVLKWPFDIDGGLLGPHRWDVVVFKDPSDGVTNFIKRLIGLPNEVLMLLDGDVFTVPISSDTWTRSTLI